jgi:hypothetical protein
LSAPRLNDQVTTITFADGSKLIVGLREWQQAWDDAMAGRPNEIYQRLKAERDRGNTDKYGMVHLMGASDPKTITEVWSG